MNNKLQQVPLEINRILDYYVSEISNILPTLIEGVYVTGSIPLGDYYSRKSDIDLITILKCIPGKDIINKLGSIHRSIEKTYSHPKLNGYYLTVDGIKNDQITSPLFSGTRCTSKGNLNLTK